MDLVLCVTPCVQHPSQSLCATPAWRHQVEAEEVDEVTIKYGVATVPYFVFLQVSSEVVPCCVQIYGFGLCTVALVPDNSHTPT
jgi:hypothetical protein